jgi:growth factor-regulated tyrosine kinase substrate
MNILKTEGFKFPEMKEVSDKLFVADVAPEWAEGDSCHRCRTTFSLVNRKHHCRHCGQVFCGACSSKTCTLPKFGIEREVRVCDTCFDQLQKPQTASSSMPTKKDAEDDLPAEYLASSLAQQNQQPVRKTEEELREEEELQLALALSQSEAESKKKASSLYRPLTSTINTTSTTNNNAAYQKSPSPEPHRSPTPEIETPSDPELARYLNRSYWEQRQTNETTSPSAPSPMPSSINLNVRKSSTDQDAEIDEFASTMRTQVEIFVNRMKSNSSRGRSIANDTSVQTLFMNITSMHSRLLTYLKEMDDKRVWYEQLQDKLAQVKDSRAALDVLRQEHVEKMRRIAEEQERQRQMQMAYKLEIMRKKKQEYLQYQRQLALQRIQEQEREMHMRQEQQKAQYMMGGNAYNQASFMSPPNQSSPMHAPNPQHMFPGQYPNNYVNPQMSLPYGTQMPIAMNGNQMIQPGQHQQQQPPQNYMNPQQQQQPNVNSGNPQSAFMPINPVQNTAMQMPPNTNNGHPSLMNPQQQQLPPSKY